MTAYDLRTVSSVPLTPYRTGWEDARYQDVYWCKYCAGTAEQRDYERGHKDGKGQEATCQ